VTGTVEKRDNSYILQITPIHVSNAKTLVMIAQTIPVNEFLDGFVTPFPAGISRIIEGVTVPRRIDCPNPVFSELARANKIQGGCLLEVLLSANGEIQQIRPLRLLGYGLDEQAFNAIKNWKFRPATKDGTPLAVIVPVEVTFRVY
jgi:TonB family protein